MKMTLMVIILVALVSVALADTSWLEESFVRVVWGSDASNVDQELALADPIAAMGPDMVIPTAHLKGYAFWPSKLATIAPDLAVDDAVGPLARQLKAKGLKVVFYVGAPFVQAALREKLEWRIRDGNGNPAGDEGTVCMMSPGFDWVVEYLCELASHAPIDGIWLDGFPQMALGCSCHWCADAYKADTGLPLPRSLSADDPEYRKFVLWWHQQCLAKGRQLVDALHKVNPDMAVFANSTVGRSSEDWRFTPDGLNAVLDSPSLEQFWHVDRQGDPLNPLFAILRARSTAAGQPVEVFTPLVPHTMDCTTALPRVETLARGLTVLSAGAVPQCMYGPGRDDYLIELLDAIKARQPYLEGAEQVRWCGIAASSLTGLMYGRAQADARYWREVKGWLRAFTEAHLPVELLSDAQLEAGDFEGLQVIALPATACLSEKAQNQLRAFVDAGGGLLATSVTSLADEEGELDAQFGLEDVLGTSFQRLEERSPLPMWWPLYPKAHPLAEGEWVEEAKWRQWSGLGHPLNGMGLPGRYVYTTPVADRQVAWTIEGEQPAIFSGNFGAGKVVYFGPEVGAAYYNFSYPYLRHLMTEAALLVAPAAPELRIEGSLMLQATYWRQPLAAGGSRLIVQLLNEASSFGRVSLGDDAMPLREEVFPLAGVTVEAPEGSSFSLQPEGLSLQASPVGAGRVKLELPPLGLHTLLVIE